LLGLNVFLFSGNIQNVYIGGTAGIYNFQFDTLTGKPGPVIAVAETVNPSFLAVHPNGKTLYAVNETAEFQGTKTGSVSAYTVDLNGKLILLNQKPSGGKSPCHLIVDRAGKNLLVANYSGGSFEIIPLSVDGSMKEPSAVVQHKGKDPEPGKKPPKSKCHFINTDPSDKYVFVADLGLDRVFFYKYDGEKGIVAPNDPPALLLPPKSGPRHFAWHPFGRYAYIINETNSTITAVSFDPEKGTLKELQTISTLPAGFTDETDCAEIQVHPSGKFLYGSNRGHDSIAIFSIDEKTGKLAALGHEPTQGNIPRNFCIDPSGKYLLAANQKSNNIVIFALDPETGLLQPTGEKIDLPAPMCIKFLPLY
jgi:6-phosphogluconolactonase